MSNTSNFRQAFREAQNRSLVGSNVIAKALPYVGGGLVLTAVGTYGGLGIINSYPELFFSSFLGAVVVELIFFFFSKNLAKKGKHAFAFPILAIYSLLSGYTLSGLVFVALGTQGVGIQGIGIAALSCGITFIVARQIGSNLSESDGMALTKTISLGILALVVVCLTQFVFALFGVYTPSWLEIGISGLGVFLFAGASVVDFYILPRTYTNEEYLPAALSMYLTYINLFVFILRLLIAINTRD